MSIYEIKRIVEETGSFYFSRGTMRFFRQRLRDFSVIRQSDGRYRISAAFGPGVPRGTSVRYFNPQSGKLELQ